VHKAVPLQRHSATLAAERTAVDCCYTDIPDGGLTLPGAGDSYSPSPTRSRISPVGSHMGDLYYQTFCVHRDPVSMSTYNNLEKLFSVLSM